MINELIKEEDLILFTSTGRINLANIYYNEGMKDIKAKTTRF